MIDGREAKPHVVVPYSFGVEEDLARLDNDAVLTAAIRKIGSRLVLRKLDPDRGAASWFAEFP